MSLANPELEVRELNEEDEEEEEQDEPEVMNYKRGPENLEKIITDAKSIVNEDEKIVEKYTKGGGLFGTSAGTLGLITGVLAPGTAAVSLVGGLLGGGGAGYFRKRSIKNKAEKYKILDEDSDELLDEIYDVAQWKKEEGAWLESDLPGGELLYKDLGTYRGVGKIEFRQITDSGIDTYRGRYDPDEVNPSDYEDGTLLEEDNLEQFAERLEE